MYRLALLWIISNLPFICFSQKLPASTEIRLLTCGAGSELYSTFGHSALWISDPASGLDRVYNYGTFDFNTPNFYLQFTRGKLRYFVEATNFTQFAYTYQAENRWIYAQKLNLNEEQRNTLYAFLENNLLPDNREYAYDFLYDNCSTRLRDALEKALGNSLVYPESELASSRDSTFRNMLDLYLSQHPWSDLGIDLALGMPCDKKPDFRERMFLPDYLKSGIAKAGLSQGNQFVPLVSESVFILPLSNQMPNESKSVNWIFWTFCAIVAILSIFGKSGNYRLFDMIFFSLIGLLGLAIFLLWFATDHNTTRWNLNLLWASPTWLWLAYQLAFQKINPVLFKIHAITMMAILIFWIVLPQNFHAAVAPLCLALGFRAWTWQKVFFKPKHVSKS